MRLKNAIDTLFPHIPDNLLPHLTVHSTCTLTDREIQIIGLGLKLVGQYVETGNEIIQTIHTNMVTYDTDELTTIHDDEETLGNNVSYILYPVHRWRKRNLGDLQILTCVIEEMCHCFWIIRDEVIVKYKVVEILKQLSPEIAFETVYTGNPPCLNMRCQTNINFIRNP